MEESISFYVTVLYKDFLAYTEKALKELGLSFGQMPFVVYIGKHADCTPSEVKTQLHVDWGHCHRTLARLEEDGFITQKQDKGKARTHYLRLTDLGEKAFDESHRVFHTWDQELKQHLEAEDWQKVADLLGKLAWLRREAWNHENI